MHLDQRADVGEAPLGLALELGTHRPQVIGGVGHIGGTGVITPRDYVSVVERLTQMLDTLVMRGLRACGREELAQLESYRDELRGIGAEHLASSLDELLRETREGERAAARTLLRAQASLRVFERLLTQRAVAAQLSAVLEAESSTPPSPPSGGKRE